MGSLKSKYLHGSPGGYFLENNVALLETYLLDRSWLSANNGIAKIEIPGAGNMNAVFRVIPKKGNSFIIKQARPWVEKYPELPAPIERIHVENHYYQRIANHPLLTKLSPGIIGFDPENSLLVMEDLGEASDFSIVYQKKENFSEAELDAAIDYLNNLKRISAPARYPTNTTLRKLNHQHIFILPFIENRFKLDEIQPGLEHLSQKCKSDTVLTALVEKLGQTYLDKGHYLLHGDYYPGSLLKSENGLKVIDPEFSFAGPEEWDIAIFTAHLFLSFASPKQIQYTFSRFQQSSEFSEQLFAGFVGTEILRRLIGLAQLPLEMSLREKAQLIDQSIKWIKNGKIDTLSRYEDNVLRG